MSDELKKVGIKTKPIPKKPFKKREVKFKKKIKDLSKNSPVKIDGNKQDTKEVKKSSPQKGNLNPKETSSSSPKEKETLSSPKEKPKESEKRSSSNSNKEEKVSYPKERSSNHIKTNKIKEGEKKSSSHKDKDTRKEDKDSSSYSKEKEEKEEVFDLENLLEMIRKNNNEIICLYYEEGYYKFIEIISGVNCEKIYIYIPSKYPILVSSKYKGIEINTIDEDEMEDEDTEIEENRYSPIKDILKIDDEDVEDRYKDIDIEKDNRKKIANYIKETSAQLERLKLCVSKIKYKICIKSHISDTNTNIISMINRSNDIYHFSYRGSFDLNSESGRKNKEVTIVVDLENYYNNFETINTDIKRVLSEMYLILGKSHTKDFVEFKSRMEIYSRKLDSISIKYRSLRRYTILLENIKNKILLLNIKEKNLEDLETKERNSNKGEANKIFILEKIKSDKERLINIRKTLLKLNLKYRNTFNNGLMDFDNVLFNNLILMKNLIRNMASV